MSVLLARVDDRLIHGQVVVGWARALEAELAIYNLGRLNPLGLNLAAPALFAFGTEEQRRRWLPGTTSVTPTPCSKSLRATIAWK